MTARVKVDVAGAVGRLVLAVPERGNVLDAEAARALTDALMEFEGDDHVRAVLLTAEGPDFCTGTDLAALAVLLDAPADAHEHDASDLGRVFLTMRGMQKPVVAAVQGKATGTGAGLATACDVVLARDDAKFSYPDVRRGFVPAMILNMLRRSVGEKHAFDLIASGRIIDAAEAERIGLVSRVVPTMGWTDAVERYVLSLAASSSVAMGITKRLFYRLDGVPFREGIAEGVRSTSEARATEDFRTGIQQFLKRGE